MPYLPNILFSLILVASIWFFARNVGKLSRNIGLGKAVDLTGPRRQRWVNMARIAMGQTKMVVRPVAGIMHFFVYLGFVIINIEVLEIIIDGVLGTHRIFAPLGALYNVLIAAFEILALLVIVAVVVFWLRRNFLKLRRFIKPEMKGWPKHDANIILYIELALMLLFLTMNAADYQLQQHQVEQYTIAGSFPVSVWLTSFFEGLSVPALIAVERTAWWLHILGILAFLNYLYYSKHLHILLAFPNTFYASLEPMGQFRNNEAVMKEVRLMMDPQADPYAVADEGTQPPEKFGASDVMDLSWRQLLAAYTCTECGRCTSECPANMTGKKLSPRKIMMDTRDRAEEVGRNIDANGGTFAADWKQLLHDYITPEELWACTTCNACVQACPVSIDPLSIIMDMRRYLVMEQSAAPTELNLMMGNIENNAAPWPFNQMDRLDWAGKK
jgi:heterodisulfide reductase subunit C